MLLKKYIYFVSDLRIVNAGHLADTIVRGNSDETGKYNSNAVARCDDIHRKLLSRSWNLSAHTVVCVDVGTASLESLDENDGKDY